MDSVTSIIGMPWYRPEDYDAARRIMADGDQFPPSYDIWRRKAEAGEKELKLDGHIVVRAYIDPETFADWCRARAHNVDAHARIHFANLVAKEAYGSTH